MFIFNEEPEHEDFGGGGVKAQIHVLQTSACRDLGDRHCISAALSLKKKHPVVAE